MLVYGIDIIEMDGTLKTASVVYESKAEAEKWVKRYKQKKWVKDAKIRYMMLFRKKEENEED